MSDPEETTEESTEAIQPEGTSQEPSSVAWNEVGDQLRKLGESVAAALRESADSETARKVKEDANRTAAKVKEAGDSTAQKAKPAVLSALKFLDEGLANMIARLEAGAAPGEAEESAENNAPETEDTEG